MDEQREGEIITFYSYKGGTGRSMALANVAWLLAQNYADRPVLMIDWDLEAPGLHRFFRTHIGGQKRASIIDIDLRIDAQIGLIDYFIRLRDKIPPPRSTSSDHKLLASPISPRDDFFKDFTLDRYLLPTTLDNLYLLKAGRFDEKYSEKINTFSWEKLFFDAPWLFPAFAQWLKQEFAYVLIDSRTGLTDTSGICTTLMPDRLVTVFTPNRQSLMGVVNSAEEATRYRKQSTDLRPLMVFPLPSRIEIAEDERRQAWRRGRVGNKPEENLPGYQPLFEDLFKRAYDLAECDLTQYFNQVQLLHVPRYLYGEEIAVVVEESGERAALSTAYTDFTERLATLDSPWESLKAETVIADSVSSSTGLETTAWNRDTLMLMYELFNTFVLKERRTFYKVTVSEAREAAGQISWFRAIFAFLAGVSLGLTGVLVASGADPLLVNILVAISIAVPLLALFFLMLHVLYDHDRTVTIYDTAIENLEVADAQSPLDNMDNLIYRASLNAFVDGTLAVMQDETNQWGQLIRTPGQFDRFITEAKIEAQKQSK